MMTCTFFKSHSSRLGWCAEVNLWGLMWPGCLSCHLTNSMKALNYISGIIQISFMEWFYFDTCALVLLFCTESVGRSPELPAVFAAEEEN